MAVMVFKHEALSSKVDKVIEKFGTEGYYVWYRVYEYLTFHKNAPVMFSDPDCEIYNSFKPVSYERAKEILAFMQDNYNIFNRAQYHVGFLIINDLAPRKTNKTKTENEITAGKKQVADYVYLRQSEINTFVKEYGEPFLKRCIEILNFYKENNGGVARYVNDASAIRAWVIGRVKKEVAEANRFNTPKQTNRKSADEFR